jgi:hypothetical protein
MHLVQDCRLHKVCNRFRPIGDTLWCKYIVFYDNLVVDPYNLLRMPTLLHVALIAMLDLVQDIVTKFTGLNCVLLLNVRIKVVGDA